MVGRLAVVASHMQFGQSSSMVSSVFEDFEEIRYKREIRSIVNIEVFIYTNYFIEFSSTNSSKNTIDINIQVKSMMLLVLK